MLRPVPARWFEVLCPRADSTRVVGLLARTGAVEIEVRAAPANRLRLQELDQGLARYRALLPVYGRYWNRGRLTRSPEGRPPRQTLSAALARLDAWQRLADPVIEALQDREDEHQRLGLCARVMTALGDSTLDLAALGHLGPCLARVAAILPRGVAEPAPEPDLLYHRVALPGGQYLLAVGPSQQVAGLSTRLQTLGARLLLPPPWLQGRPREAGTQIAARRTRLEQEISAGYARLDRLHRELRLGDALGDLACLEWFTSQVGTLELASARFTLITGWTSTGRACLASALDRDGTPALLHFPPAPAGSVAPQLLVNPPWARPFELFARALGVPGGDEADPSPLLALVVPLLFGYMFGDLGQGLVLAAAGWWLRGRSPLAPLLLAAGLSAALFGLVFGSLFSMEDLLPPLWLHPLAHPVTVLTAPLVLAVALLTLGQLLHGLEARWRGQGSDWLRQDAGLLLAYLSTAAGLALGLPAWPALLGVVWYLAGAVHRGGPLHGLAAAGELLERGLQLLVNTLSFARVGAFALAHAGLSSALVALAEASGSAAATALILVTGNLVIILLEGLVVTIQTTRLVLFEFFTRFLQGNGRVFRPLPAPPTILQGETR
jgi:V/A-type H+-transporting ATPase subunit I